MVESGGGGPSLGWIVVPHVDATAPGGGGRRRPAAAPPEVEGRFPAPGPRRVSRKVLVVHLYREGVSKGREVAATY